MERIKSTCDTYCNGINLPKDNFMFEAVRCELTMEESKMTNKRGKQRAVHVLVPSCSFIHGSVFKRTQNTQILRLLHHRRDKEMWFTALSTNQSVNIKMICSRRHNCAPSLFYRSFYGYVHACFHRTPSETKHFGRIHNPSVRVSVT